MLTKTCHTAPPRFDWRIDWRFDWRIKATQLYAVVLVVMFSLCYPSPASAQNGSATATAITQTETVIQSDAPCLVLANGVEIARLRTGDVKRVLLSIGEQHIEAFGEHPEDYWEKTLLVEPGIKRVVTIGMKRISSMRSQRELGEKEHARKSAEKDVLLKHALTSLSDPRNYVPLEPGTYERGGGENGPVHEVAMTLHPSIGIYEVSQAQWEAVMGYSPSSTNAAHHPVESVSWFEAHIFIDSLNTMSPPNVIYRLPTEAEWEYACLAGSEASTAIPLTEAVWYSENSGEQTHRVGTKRANAWGLYDMRGNVWEWVEDWYGLYQTEDAVDPISAETGRARVIRGGSWWSPGEYTTCTHRGNLAPDFRATILGFRLVREEL